MKRYLDNIMVAVIMIPVWSLIVQQPGVVHDRSVDFVEVARFIQANWAWLSILLTYMFISIRGVRPVKRILSIITKLPIKP